ncbi:GGDEF domain-containing protein [Paucibacter sp. TC2R-5]|uniref:GGDEF domain-containing protein n=1 Tax=Paucibacter sp. TC2R-5 TaxID=2893555 RepID=UPI0021E3D892|nr:GGDEF domain-containing protein [Paucibacter sp. TC2R-5]MCV2358381.1 GGDEF domain-containing protein [Paucibacter sp. TC2R-5]
MSAGLGTDPLTLLAATMLLYFVACVAWLLLAMAARVAPRVSLGLALANGLLAAALACLSLRGQASAWLAFWGADVLALATLASLRLVMPALSDGRDQASNPALAWPSALGLLLPAALALAWLPYEGDMRWQTRIVFGSGLALTLLAAVDAWRQLRARLSLRLASQLAAPLFVIALLLLLPLVNSLIRPTVAFDLLQNSEFQLAWGWAMLGLGLLINATMALLVLARVVLDIQRLTRLDPLTAVLNRRALSEAIDDEHLRLQRGKPYALVMIDMDHFKQLNDNLGHAAGDAALLRAVQVLSPCVRDVDRLGRLGGEEFCVLLPLTDLAGAALVAERMRHNMEASSFEWQGKTWPLTASFGVAEALPEDVSADAVLRRADKGMYRAKAQGRNLVQEA